MEIQYSSGIPIFIENSLFNSKTLTFKFNIQQKLNMQQKSRLNGNSTSMEYLMLNDKN